MRITSQMMMNTYKRNVGDSFASLNKAMQQAYDYRSFELPSDDPLAAAQTFNCHWEMSLNDNYSSNVQNLQGIAQTADSILQNVDGIVGSNASGSTAIATLLQGISGTMNSDNKNTIGNEMLTVRDSIIQKMNAKYGDSYIFGGSNGGTAPFQMVGNQLYYRGINVDTGENMNGASVSFKDTTGATQVDFGKAIGNQLNGYKLDIKTSQGSNSAVFSESSKTITINVTGTSLTKGDLQTALQGLGTQTLSGGGSLDFTKVTVEGNTSDHVNVPTTGATGNITDMIGQSGLDALANEKVYVDIGLGITSTNGKVDDQSAYNSALTGISYLGYGTRSITNDDGSFSNIPCNICSLLTTIGNDLKNSGSESNADLIKQLSPYIDSLKDSQTNFQSQQAQMGQQMSFLSDTASYLSSMKINLSTKDNNVEFVDPSDAIESFYMQQYCYNAALKVGGQILQQSLMDYLK